MEKDSYQYNQNGVVPKNVTMAKSSGSTFKYTESSYMEISLYSYVRLVNIDCHFYSLIIILCSLIVSYERVCINTVKCVVCQM